jgi:hypothetical protein
MLATDISNYSCFFGSIGQRREHVKRRFLICLSHGAWWLRQDVLTENDVVASSSVGAKVSLSGLREARVPVYTNMNKKRTCRHNNRDVWSGGSR